MESQLHRHYDDPLHDTGVTDVHDERSHGGETKSAMEKVKAKLEKVKDTINKHSHSHHDREHHSTDTKVVNDSAPVRSGMVQPTEMGTPVLVEDLYATHSDIVDPPTRSFEEWEEDGLPPPLPTGMLYGTHHPTDVVQLSHHVYSHDVNNEQIEQLKDPVEKSNVVMEEDIPHNPPNSTTTFSPQTTSGGKEIGITGVLKSFDKMGIYDEPDSKSPKSEQNDPNVYTGSHDQFAPEHVESTLDVDTLSKSPNSRQNKQNVYTAPEHVEYTPIDTISKSPKPGSHDDELAATTEPIANPPLDTIAADPSNPNSSYAQKVTSATCAVADKAVGVKDTIASKLFGENKAAATRKPSFSTTDFAHKVADTMTGTFVPVYEKVVGAKTAVMTKIHGSGHDDENTREPAESKKVTVRKYLVDTFRPGDEDKVLSEVITNAFHRGKGINTPTLQETSTYVAVIDEGERRLQDSTN